jgi:hypothetical protein
MKFRRINWKVVIYILAGIGGLYLLGNLIARLFG